MAYKVDPPHWWSRQLHPVFHVSMLKPFYEDTSDPSRGQIRRPGLKPKAAGKRVAEAILNDRVITASRKRHQEYLVKWQGYMDEENTWERAADLSAYTDKIEAYHMQKLTRASTALPLAPAQHRAHPSQRPRAHPTRAHAPLQVLQVSRPCTRQAQRPRAQLQCLCTPKANREDLKIQACIINSGDVYPSSFGHQQTIFLPKLSSFTALDQFQQLLGNRVPGKGLPDLLSDVDGNSAVCSNNSIHGHQCYLI
ncbi:hypothetical protein RJ640_027892 [Escallonia rubra]|uniref:Chromo domain-containing protein n=1 Tax=Escallonia rubra TaxID=112253 RepID=A0AA88RR73_9ASTE|nr:hypothetical protein RJ640_027892 [Escallonia rubra]